MKEKAKPYLYHWQQEWKLRSFRILEKKNERKNEKDMASTNIARHNNFDLSLSSSKLGNTRLLYTQEHTPLKVRVCLYNFFFVNCSFSFRCFAKQMLVPLFRKFKLRSNQCSS